MTIRGHLAERIGYPNKLATKHFNIPCTTLWDKLKQETNGDSVGKQFYHWKKKEL